MRTNDYFPFSSQLLDHRSICILTRQVHFVHRHSSADSFFRLYGFVGVPWACWKARRSRGLSAPNAETVLVLSKPIDWSKAGFRVRAGEEPVDITQGRDQSSGADAGRPSVADVRF